MLDNMKKWIELIFSITFSFMAQILEGLKLDWLQKIFYLLSIILLIIAIIKLLKGTKFGPEKMMKATGVVDQSFNPENKAKLFITIYNLVKKGGTKIMNKIKALGWVKVISLLLTFVLILLGFLSAVIPGLEVVANNLEGFFILLGLVSTPGLVSKGRELSGLDKQKEDRRKGIRGLKRELKQLSKDEALLKEEYDWLTVHVDRVNKFGGNLTENQSEAKNNYDTQLLTLNSKVALIKEKLEALENDPN